jgi:hypothetical protein
MNDKTYNGWSNYATWRINLEIFDGMELDLDAYMGEESKFDAYDLKDELQRIAEEIIFEGMGYDERRPSNLVEDYARAFLQDVNYYEIADHLIKDYAEVHCLLCDHVWDEVTSPDSCPHCGNTDKQQTVYKVTA